VVAVMPAGPPGTLGFVISGRLTSAEYQEVLLPPIRETIASGEALRVLAVIDDFRGLEPGGLLEDLRAAAKLGAGQGSFASRFALVADAEWVGRAIALFGWLVPGEVRVFTSARRADAEEWLVTAGDR
jgi:hypothetical protein